MGTYASSKSSACVLKVLNLSSLWRFAFGPTAASAQVLGSTANPTAMRSGPPKIVGEKTADMAHTFARKIAVQIADYKLPQALPRPTASVRRIHQTTKRPIPKDPAGAFDYRQCLGVLRPLGCHAIGPACSGMAAMEASAHLVAGLAQTRLAHQNASSHGLNRWLGRWRATLGLMLPSKCSWSMRAKAALLPCPASGLTLRDSVQLPGVICTDESLPIFVLIFKQGRGQQARAAQWPCSSVQYEWASACAAPGLLISGSLVFEKPARNFAAVSQLALQCTGTCELEQWHSGYAKKAASTQILPRKSAAAPFDTCTGTGIGRAMRGASVRNSRTCSVPSNAPSCRHGDHHITTFPTYVQCLMGEQ
ncbi:uncharacterized protein TRIREDRAFT_110026 [Trichoderma reesei QM6a]|uniref:Predicted protein n=2 Tax=Hypocrea jecorina TaxID=51453 RepID=G0RR13_HYPJQ|nr:uncharacterized protein TRIREDRAFT_110026 [Trichoderma reesei QM6a]EGR46357.1 predicted protein [Trichoderma reesei QM6a]ETR99498.1 hypothetical protein M419DRAFT_132423 [Trichoderma reesei RUT C-30]